MKKKILLIVAAAIMVFAFTACGKDLSNSKYLGTWKATSVEYGGMELSVKSALGGDWIMVLNDNGKCEVTIQGETKTGKWDETEKGFIVEDEFEVAVDGDKGTMDYEGMTMNFERKK